MGRFPMKLSIAVLAAVLALAAAQAPGRGVSKNTFAANDPVPGKEWMYKYFPVGTPQDECTGDICTCPAGTGGSTEWYIQQGRVYALESMQANGPAGNGFGMHLVNVSNHVTTGGMSVAEVESQFVDKLSDMATRFDSFMDYNSFFYTTALETYAATFKSDGVPTYTTTWSYQGKTWTSVFVHVPGTQHVIELCQDVSLSTVDATTPHHAIPRASPRAIEMIQKSNVEAGSAIISPLAVNRAVSTATLAKLDDFYVTGMGTTKSESTAANDVTKVCYLWPGASVDVCFYNRADTETKGEWKVGDFESMLNTVHNNIIVGPPLCGTDKWLDNHYAIDSRSADGAKIVSYVEANNIPHKCETGFSGSVAIHYIIDPTGWGIQTDLQYSTAPADCSAAAAKLKQEVFPVQDHQNPASTPGTCA